jgi:hypothetical protein
VTPQGIGCAREEYPGVYASISAAYDWIQGQICDLSDNPPKGCGGVVAGTRVRIDIHYDGFPRDTGWELRDGDGVRVATSRAGTVADKECLLSEYVEVSDGVYEFKITDDFGDGLTVPDGKYSVFEIKPDGSEVLKLEGDGEFSEVKKEFEIGSGTQNTGSAKNTGPSQPSENEGPSQQSGPSQNELVLVKVEIDINDKPRDVGWEITDVDDNIWVEHEAGTYKKKEKFSHVVELESGSYTFSMKAFDSAEGMLNSSQECLHSPKPRF